MAAENANTAVLQQITLKNTAQNMPQGYFRSKIFVAPFSTNPIIAASGPVLSLLDRLCLTQELPPITTMRESLEHELGAFLSRLGHLNYASEFTAIAYYLLCATVDELVGKNYLRVHQTIAEFTAFTPPSPPGEAGPEEYFFKIVDIIKERPSQYLDLTELAYYCLIAGFEGKHHSRGDGRMNLDNLLENLYQIIQQNRVDKPHHLFKKVVPMASPAKKHLSLVPLCIISISIVAVSLFISQHFLESKTQTLQMDHQIIAQLNTQRTSHG